MGKTKKINLMDIEDVEKAKVQPTETVEQILNQPKVEDAFAITPALREALMVYLGTKPLNESEALYTAVKGSYPIKLTINPA